MYQQKISFLWWCWMRSIFNSHVCLKIIMLSQGKNSTCSFNIMSFLLVHKFLPSFELSKTVRPDWQYLWRVKLFKELCQSDKGFSTVNYYVLSFWYLDQSLLTGFSGKTTVTVVKHTFIWNQSTNNMANTWPIALTARKKSGVKKKWLRNNQ